MKIQVDDILAALILSLAMLRRLDVKATTAAQNPRVPEAGFLKWRSLALRAFDQIAAASAGKVVLSIGWFALGLKLGVPAPWFQLVGFAVFVAWAVLLVWAWKIATDARYLRVQLGIRLRREAAADARRNAAPKAAERRVLPPKAAEPRGAEPRGAEPRAVDAAAEPRPTE